jgi:hypothetical protein
VNERNVAALAAVVLEMAQEFGTTLDGIEWDQDGQRRVAEWLDARGVSAPSRAEPLAE